MLKWFSFFVFLFFLAACQKNPALSSLKSSDNSAVRGLINGRLEGRWPGVVSLSFLQDSVCTGTLVGLHPPTVITARHCAYDYMSEIFSVSPEKIITLPFEKVSVKAAEGPYPGDLAVLIYPEFLAEVLGVQPEDLFTVAPANIQAHEEIFLCGYGNTNHSARYATGSGQRKCGSSQVILEDRHYDFSEEMNFFKLYFRKIRKSFPTFTREEKVKYVHSRLQKSLVALGPGVYFGVGRLTPDAFTLNPKKGYDEEGLSVLSNKGDSGGPWFVHRTGPHPHLVAVTVVGIPLPNVEEELIGSLGWRLDHPWSKALLAKAHDEGADILGLSELLAP